jgi:hypothetical protein
MRDSAGCSHLQVRYVGHGDMHLQQAKGLDLPSKTYPVARTLNLRVEF